MRFHLWNGKYCYHGKLSGGISVECILLHWWLDVSFKGSGGNEGLDRTPLGVHSPIANQIINETSITVGLVKSSEVAMSPDIFLQIFHLPSKMIVNFLTTTHLKTTCSMTTPHSKMMPVTIAPFDNHGNFFANSIDDKALVTDDSFEDVHPLLTYLPQKALPSLCLLPFILLCPTLWLHWHIAPDNHFSPYHLWFIFVGTYTNLVNFKSGLTEHVYQSFVPKLHLSFQMTSFNPSNAFKFCRTKISHFPSSVYLVSSCTVN